MNDDRVVSRGHTQARQHEDLFMRYLFVTGCSGSGEFELASRLNLHPEVSIGVGRYANEFLSDAILTPAHFSREKFLKLDIAPTADLDLTRSNQDGIPQEYKTSNYLGDAIPGLYRNMEVLFNNFKNTKVLFICKAPLEFLSTRLGLSAQERAELKSVSREEIMRHLEEWNESLSAVLPFIRRGKVLPVSFEHLLKDGSGWQVVQQYLELKDPLPNVGRVAPQTKSVPVDEVLACFARKHADWGAYDEILSQVHPGRKGDMYSKQDRPMIDYAVRTVPGLSFSVRDPSDRSVVCVGSAATFGRFVRRPFPMQINASNYALGGARPETFAGEPVMLCKLAMADVSVIEATSARGCANSVFEPTSRLSNLMRLTPYGKSLREFDGMAENIFIDRLWERMFNRNKSLALRVISECQTAWLEDMKILIAQCKRPIVLFFAQEYPPSEIVSKEEYRFPHLITDPMLRSLGAELLYSVSRAGIPYQLKDDAGVPVPLMKEWKDPTMNSYYPSQEMHDLVAAELISRLSAI